MMEWMYGLCPLLVQIRFWKTGFRINFIDQRYIAYGEGYVFVHNPFLGGITFFTLLWRSQVIDEYEKQGYSAYLRGSFSYKPKKIHFTCYTIPVPSSEVQGTYRSSGLIVPDRVHGRGWRGGVWTWKWSCTGIRDGEITFIHEIMETVHCIAR